MLRLFKRKKRFILLLTLAIAGAVIYVFHPSAALGTFPTNATILDNFNRSDNLLHNSPNASSGDTWSNQRINGGGTNDLQISSSQLGSSTGSATNGYLTSNYGPDVEVYCNISVLPASGNYVFFITRLHDQGTTSFDGYGMIYIATDTWQIRRYDNGTSTVLASATQAVSAGDSIGFSAVGSTLTAYYKPSASATWTSLFSTTDSTYSNAGPIGLELGDTTARVDDLSGGTVVTNSSPSSPTLSNPSDNATNISTTPRFQLRSGDADNDYLRYKIDICSSADCSSIVRTIDQTASQTGWNGQDAQGGTAYTGDSLITSSTIASYDYQAPALGPNTQYWWRAYAIDPGGTNTFSTASATQSFTTAATILPPASPPPVTNSPEPEVTAPKGSSANIQMK